MTGVQMVIDCYVSILIYVCPVQEENDKFELFTFYYASWSEGGIIIDHWKILSKIYLLQHLVLRN